MEQAKAELHFLTRQEAEPVCQYSGRDFGASYPDSVCIGGFLWDADSCDEPGGPLLNGGEIPCPECNAEARKQYLNARQSRKG